MTAAAVFGPIVTTADVENAVIGHVKTWLPTYLAEMERRTGRDPGVLPLPRDYSIVNTFTRFPEDQSPLLIVVSPGFAAKPETDGDGSISAWWRVGLAVCVSANTRENANDLAKLYGAALLTLFSQHPGLDGFASGLDIDDFTLDDVPADYLEVGATAQLVMNVKVDEIANRYAGPSAPTVATPSDWPDAATVGITYLTRSPE